MFSVNIHVKTTFLLNMIYLVDLSQYSLILFFDIMQGSCLGMRKIKNDILIHLQGVAWVIMENMKSHGISIFPGIWKVNQNSVCSLTK